MEGWGKTRADGDFTASYYDATQNKVRYLQFFFTSSSVERTVNQKEAVSQPRNGFFFYAFSLPSLEK